MSVYLIADINVINRERYEAYRRLLRNAIRLHKGQYLVRGGSLRVVEGSWQPPRLVMIEFPSRALAEQFLASPEYAQARDTAANATMIDMILVEGIDKAKAFDDEAGATWSNLRI